MDTKQKLSFVIPCYRSEHTVALVMDEIEAVVEADGRWDYEIIAVNDCSPDNVWDVLEKRALSDPHVTAVELAKNMGRISALMAGFSILSGSVAVVLDDDGQCPMDQLFRLVEALTPRVDVAIADYPVKKQSPFKNFGSRVNEKMTQWIIDKPAHLHFTNFMVLRRYVVEEIIKYENPYPYMTGLVLRTTSRIVNVPMEERERISGQSTYTFKKLVGHWMNGLTAFSVKPLRAASVLGVCCAAAGFIWGLVTVIRKIVNPANILSGYSSTMSAVLFIGGIILLVLGMLGEYMGRSYISINRSPQYVIRQVCGRAGEREPAEGAQSDGARRPKA